MNNEVLEKVKLLPRDKQKEVEDFVEYLLSKYSKESIDIEALAEKRMKNMGRMRGQIWMADDFNETPEDFKDYI